jgi:hypothetical protein
VVIRKDFVSAFSIPKNCRFIEIIDNDRAFIKL